MMLKKALFCIVAMTALLSGAAEVVAKDLVITCTGPTKYVDSTPIPAGKVISYKLFGGLAGAPKVQLDPVGTATAKTACSFTRTNVAMGTQEYYLLASVDGADSDPSLTVSAVVAPPKPGSPTNVAVVELVAYERQNDGSMRVVGVVPEGTLCTGVFVMDNNGIQFNRLDQASVDLTAQPDVLPPVVYGRCG
jgi:hypothetical protein